MKRKKIALPFKHARAVCVMPRSTPCRLAFVADEPSDDDMDHGRILCGSDGRVLSQMLRCANIEREDCLITSLADSPEDAPERHLERLKQELEECKPAIVVPLGPMALSSLTNDSAHAASRGSCVLATQLMPGVKVLPTYHPATVMKQWKMFHVAVADIVKADTEANTPGKLQYTERNIWIRPTLKDLGFFERDHLSSSSLISVDIETHRTLRQITCLGFGASATHSIVVPFMDWSKPNRSYWATAQDEASAWSWCERICRSATPKLLQNGTYDCWYLWDLMGIPVMNYRHDTRLMHHALYPELPKSLALLGSLYANEGPWKNMRGSGQTQRRDDL